MWLVYRQFNMANKGKGRGSADHRPGTRDRPPVESRANKGRGSAVHRPGTSDRPPVESRAKKGRGRTIHRPDGSDRSRSDLEVFDHKKALRATRASIERLQLKNDMVFKRLEHALQLVRKQRTRYEDMTVGRAPLGGRCASGYKFVCDTCKKQFNTFNKLRDHDDYERESDHKTDMKIKKEDEPEEEDEQEEDYDDMIM